MTNYHESEEKLSAATMDMSRAINSLREELEAVDWYQQREDAASDAELKAILAHNRAEAKEHAAMVLEWIRLGDPTFDAKLKEVLFREGPIAGDHGPAAAEPGAPQASAGAPRSTVGSLVSRGE